MVAAWLKSRSSHCCFQECEVVWRARKDSVLGGEERHEFPLHLPSWFMVTACRLIAGVCAPTIFEPTPLSTPQPDVSSQQFVSATPTLLDLVLVVSFETAFHYITHTGLEHRILLSLVPKACAITPSSKSLSFWYSVGVPYISVGSLEKYLRTKIYKICILCVCVVLGIKLGVTEWNPGGSQGHTALIYLYQDTWSASRNPGSEARHTILMPTS
jgi:hypothetical protein